VDADIDWRSDAKIKLDVTLKLGMRVGVTVDEFDLRGKVRNFVFACIDLTYG